MEEKEGTKLKFEIQMTNDEIKNQASRKKRVGWCDEWLSGA